MKKLLAALSLTGLSMLAATVGAQQPKPSEPATRPPAAGARAMPAAKLPEDGTPVTMSGSASMKHMQEVMSKIHASKDPKELEALLDEHMKLMRDHMKEMRGMMGPGMKEGMEKGMGKGMQGGDQKSDQKSGGPKSGGSKNSAMMGGDMMPGMQMMHGMMEQMLEHMEAQDRLLKDGHEDHKGQKK